MAPLSVLCLCVLLSAVAPGVARAAPATPMSAEAKRHLDAALEAFRTKDYVTARTEFAASYDAEPNPELLYPWAQATRLGGDCESAIPLYRRYLEAKPDQDAAERTRRQIERCEQVVAHKQPPAHDVENEAGEVSKPVPPAVTAPAPAPTLTLTPAPAPTAERPTRPLVEPVLLFTGIAAAAAGGGLYLASAIDEGQLPQSPTYARFEGTVRRVDRERTIGNIALGAASLALTSLLVEHLIAQRR